MYSARKESAFRSAFLNCPSYACARAPAVHRARQVVLDALYQARPERFVRSAPKSLGVPQNWTRSEPGVSDFAAEPDGGIHRVDPRCLAERAEHLKDNGISARLQRKPGIALALHRKLPGAKRRDLHFKRGRT